MERRLITLVLASTIFITVYLGLNVFLPRPNAPGGNQENPQTLVENEFTEKPLEDSEVANLDQPQTPASPGTDSEPAAENSDAETGNAASIGATASSPARARAVSWTTLGSMAPDSGYNMLVTLRSQGGAIDRIELTERKEDGSLKYRRVDVRNGYLGYMALAATANGDGVIVRIVGPGTPAALAKPLSGGPIGLQVGDRIVAAGNRAIAGPADLAEVLSKTKPGDVLPLEIVRKTGSQTEAPTDETPEASAPTPEAGEAAGEDDPSETPAAPVDASTSGDGSVTLNFEAELTEHPLDLVRMADTAGADQVVGNLTRPSLLMSLSQLGERSIRSGQREMTGFPSQHRAIWGMKGNEENSQVDFRLVLPAGVVQQAGGEGQIELARVYRLEKGSYHLDLNLRVTNAANRPQKLGYRLEGPNGLTLEGWWYSTKISPNFSGAGARDLVYNTATENHELVSAYNLMKKVTKTPQDPDTVIFTPDSSDEAKQVRYIGIDTQYFTTAFIPTDEQPFLTKFSRAAGTLVAAAGKIPANQERAVNTSFFVDSNIETVAPGESISDSLRLFAGPKQPDLLDEYRLTETLEYGWFGMVAKPLSWLLHMFYAIVGNYAIAIVMLTLLVRGFMFPLSRKAAIHAQKMQELAPELKKITEKYKDDLEKRMKAQRELQQRVGFNPLSGCLPMFVQLPIFIGLYRALSVDIELRQAAVSPSWQWASNLAGPDMLVYWGDWLWDYLSGRGTGWLGPYFNILPIAVVLLFLLQQKMFMPPATDEQTAMTQKVMTVMTMMMGLFFFRVPSGLCIYFITSSLWGICERKLVKKFVPPGPKLSFDGSAGTIEGTVTGRKPSLTDRLLTAAGRPPEPESPALPPNKRKRPPNNNKKK